jgi:Ca2+-dependent lipid-binding protein
LKLFNHNLLPPTRFPSSFAILFKSDFTSLWHGGSFVRLVFIGSLRGFCLGHFGFGLLCAFFAFTLEKVRERRESSSSRISGSVN